MILEPASTRTRQPIVEQAAETRLSWTNSYWAIALLAVSVGLLSIAASIGLDWAVHDVLRQVYASDILAGAIAAAVSGIILLGMQSRRRELLVRMQIVEDVNHHVRNALAAIVLSSSLRQDSELDALVKDACDRVDWVLTNALVHTAGGKTFIAKQSDWRSGRRLGKTVQPWR